MLNLKFFVIVIKKMEASTILPNNSSTLTQEGCVCESIPDYTIGFKPFTVWTPVLGNWASRFSPSCEKHWQ